MKALKSLLCASVFGAACAPLAAPTAQAADLPVLTCAMGENQYYPDNNPAFKTVLIDLKNSTVTDGNGTSKAVLTSDATKYQLVYTANKLNYTYIVFRTTGDMNLLHKFSIGEGHFANGANYKCKIYMAKPQF